ncbi:MAG: glycosyltransferase family 2 protein [Patescibacteria group bacterium]|nr:glycosyltransferase family 2 protein [Patescibacteria group bacterium]
MEVSELSAFFPAYNEEKNIAQTVDRAFSVLSKLPLKKFEVIVINDGSQDKTDQVLEKLQKKYTQLRVITHHPNKGYGEAIKSGLYNAKYDWIVFTDADGQFDFSEVENLLAKINQAPVVVGFRLNRQDSLLRKFNGWGWTLLANILLGINIRDVDCAFKLIKKEVIDHIPHLQSTRGGMISPELIARIRKAGYPIVEVGVHHFSRSHGRQTGANIRVIIKSFIDLFKLWWQLR